MKLLITTLTMIFISFASSCTNTNKPNENSAKTGAGAALGQAIRTAITLGNPIGTVVGGVIGGEIGGYWIKKQDGYA